MTNINLNLYKIFCAVATSKSYSEASEKINISGANTNQIIELPSMNINLVYIKDQLTKVDKSFIKKYLK